MSQPPPVPRPSALYWFTFAVYVPGESVFTIDIQETDEAAARWVAEQKLAGTYLARDGRIGELIASKIA